MKIDFAAYAGYIGGGGLAGIFALAGFFFPKYQTPLNGAAVVAAAAGNSIAGFLRVKSNPTPPNGMASVVAPQTQLTKEGQFK